MILLRPICWLLGHKRGTFVRTLLDLRYFRCSRCGRETCYKIKPSVRSTGAPTDGSGT